MSAPACRACSRPSRIRAALPAMSPTVAFIWQRARRKSARAGAARRARAAGGGFAFTRCGFRCFFRTRFCRRRDARGTCERGDCALQVDGDRLELGQRVEVAEQAEAEMAVI